MEEVKLVGVLFSLLSVAFWRWVASLEKKHDLLSERQDKLAEEVREIDKNFITRAELKQELHEIKAIIKEIQKELIRNKGGL